MATFKVKGGIKLKGDLHPQGAKNEALQVLCAVLLTPNEVIMENVPNIRDVNILIDLLRDLNVTVIQINESTYRFKADKVDIDYLSSEDYKTKSSRIRGSIMIVGPLLARYGKGYIPRPGGDKIGRRRLDTHFIGFEKLGANFVYDSKEEFYRVTADQLKGTDMLLDEASVTGTANIVMTAVMAKGKTSIYNAACEPYLQQLCKMLNSMGAKITGLNWFLYWFSSHHKIRDYHQKCML
jgi:UDP-N-acetylglucosamine 1-carboxyvinyltransferase